MVALLGSVIMLLVVGASSNVSPMHGFWAFGFVDQTQCFCATMFGCSGDALLREGDFVGPPSDQELGAVSMGFGGCSKCLSFVGPPSLESGFYVRICV